MERILIPVLIVIVILIFLKKKKKPCGGARSVISRRSVQPQSPKKHMDYGEYLYKEGLEPSNFSSHRQFVKDTYSDSLLLGSSKEIVRDDPNDINPYLGLRRPNYDVVVGAGARQVPSEDRMQLPGNRAPSFV